MKLISMIDFCVWNTGYDVHSTIELYKPSIDVDWCSGQTFRERHYHCERWKKTKNEFIQWRYSTQMHNCISTVFEFDKSCTRTWQRQNFSVHFCKRWKIYDNLWKFYAVCSFTLSFSCRCNVISVCCFDETKTNRIMCYTIMEKKILNWVKDWTKQKKVIKWSE